MSTKKKPASAAKSKSKSASSKTAEAKKPEPTQPAIALETFEDLEELERHGDEYLEAAFAPYKAAIAEIKALEYRAELLRGLLPALRRRAESLTIAEIMASPETPPASPLGPHDHGLHAAVQKLELTRINWGNGGKKAPTGAIPWRQLQKTGATDAQILKNLQNVSHSSHASSLEQYDLRGGADALRFHPSGKTWGKKTHVLSGAKELVAAARRAFQIGEPVKEATTHAKGKPRASATGSKPARSSKKKPAAKSNAKTPGANANGSPVRSTKKPAAKNLGGKSQVASGNKPLTTNHQPPSSAPPRPRIKEPASGYDPKDYARAQSLMREHLNEFAALGRELGGTPNTQEILVYLGGASCDVTQLATGQAPSASQAIDSDLDADFDAEEIAARKSLQAELDGDVELPGDGASREALGATNAGPKHMTITAPNPGKKNARRRPAGVKG